jgi:hypothetical protein
MTRLIKIAAVAMAFVFACNEAQAAEMLTLSCDGKVTRSG